MKAKFTIHGLLPTLNEYSTAERTHRNIASQMKKKATNHVYLEIKAQKQRVKLDNVFLDIIYYWKDKRTDKDNIAFAKKFILDGMQKANLIPNDGWNNIKGWKESFEIDRDHPRIDVVVTGDLS